MKWVIRLSILATLCALGVFLWITLFPSPERVIRKRIGELETTASFASNEGALAKLSNASKLAGFFTPTAEMIIDLSGRSRQELAGRDQLFQVATAVRNTLQSLKVDLLDARVTVGADKRTARVNLTAKAVVPGERDFMIQELEFQMVKTGRDWLIQRVVTVRTLN